MVAIVPSDIVFLLSAPTASSGFSATGFAGTSWGKYCSTTPVSPGILDNVFQDLTGAQNAALQVDYECVFVLNNTASGNSMLNTVVWLPLPLVITGPGACTKALATDNVGFTPKGQAAAQAAVIGSSTQVPSGTSAFIGPTASSAGGISVGTVPPGFVFAVWIQRTAVGGLPFSNDGLTFEVDFDTNG